MSRIHGCEVKCPRCGPGKMLVLNDHVISHYSNGALCPGSGAMITIYEPFDFYAFVRSGFSRRVLTTAGRENTDYLWSPELDNFVFEARREWDVELFKRKHFDTEFPDQECLLPDWVLAHVITYNKGMVAHGDEKTRHRHSFHLGSLCEFYILKVEYGEVDPADLHEITKEKFLKIKQDEGCAIRGEDDIKEEQGHGDS